MKIVSTITLIMSLGLLVIAMFILARANQLASDLAMCTGELNVSASGNWDLLMLGIPSLTLVGISGYLWGYKPHK